MRVLSLSSAVTPLRAQIRAHLEALDEQSLRIEKLAEAARALQRASRQRRVTLSECFRRADRKEPEIGQPSTSVRC